MQLKQLWEEQLLQFQVLQLEFLELLLLTLIYKYFLQQQFDGNKLIKKDLKQFRIELKAERYNVPKVQSGKIYKAFQSFKYRRIGNNGLNQLQIRSIHMR